MSPAIEAILICAAAAVLEGVLAGRGVAARFGELRLPRFSPSLAVWLLIGVAYYVICFTILCRLITSDLRTHAHKTAFVIMLVLMVVNAAWGFLFFRRKDLRASFLVFFPYGLLAFVLAVLLASFDLVSSLLLAPYLAYLGYAMWWTQRLWLLNRA